MQIYADVTGREMKISRSGQTCALGAAMAGAVVAGAVVAGAVVAGAVVTGAVVAGAVVTGRVVAADRVVAGEGPIGGRRVFPYSTVTVSLGLAYFEPFGGLEAPRQGGGGGGT